MSYIITFLEGIVTFISPCVLPLLPVYVLYFAGGEADGKKSRAPVNALGFVLGFTAVFILLGLFASSLGGFLQRYSVWVNVATGAVVVLFGLNYTGLLNIGFLNKTAKPETGVRPNTFLSAMVFGIVFAIGWSPCTGAFLGSALMLASQQAGRMEGMLLLLAYSLGLGVPFILFAVLTDRLKNALDFIKRHYRAVNAVCGAFLIAVGILMMAGVFSRLTALLK